MEKEPSGKGFERRQHQVEVAVDRRYSADRRSGFDRRQFVMEVTIDRRKCKDRRAYCMQF